MTDIRPIKTIKGYNLSAIHTQYGNFILDCIRLRGISSVEDALDIRQNIYISLFKRSIHQKLPEVASIKGYIRRATRNAVTDFRKTKRREAALFDWISEDHDVIGFKMDQAAFERWWNENEDVDLRILRAIEFLDQYTINGTALMRCVIDDIYNGMTAEEIAEKHSVKLGTVFSWISRFREDLRNHMRQL